MKYDEREHYNGWDPDVDGGETPALDALLGRGWAEKRSASKEHGHPAPLECPDCAFCGPSDHPYEYIANDVSEAHYWCNLLDRAVWGEYGGDCEVADWQARARAEVGDHA